MSSVFYGIFLFWQSAARFFLKSEKILFYPLTNAKFWCIIDYVTEAYRSGHNGLDSKSSSPQGLVGSNPTASASNEEIPPRFARGNFSLTKGFGLRRKAA